MLWKLRPTRLGLISKDILFPKHLQCSLNILIVIQRDVCRMLLTSRVNLFLKKTGTTVGERHTSLWQTWHSSAYLKIFVSNINLNNSRITYMICTSCQKKCNGNMRQRTTKHTVHYSPRKADGDLASQPFHYIPNLRIHSLNHKGHNCS
jgi:hypothetical protein